MARASQVVAKTRNRLGAVGYPVITSGDDRASWAKAYGRAWAGITVAAGMIVPGLVGVWLDNRLGTRVACTLAGFGLGMAWGIWQLVRLGAVGSCSGGVERGGKGPDAT